MARDVQYFEDLDVGDERPMGSFELTESEIIAFAERFDPLPFHVDPERAEQSIFGGLIASGYHTTVMANRQVVDGFFRDTAMQGALGIDDLRWHAPVRPGDRLAVTGTIAETEPFNDALGLGRGHVEVTNGDDDTVLTMVGQLLFERRT